VCVCENVSASVASWLHRNHSDTLKLPLLLSWSSLYLYKLSLIVTAPRGRPALCCHLVDTRAHCRKTTRREYKEKKKLTISPCFPWSPFAPFSPGTPYRWEQQNTLTRFYGQKKRKKEKTRGNFTHIHIYTHYWSESSRAPQFLHFLLKLKNRTNTKIWDIFKKKSWNGFL